jgi:TetR/AcrR family transcriptional repressor of nem operon
MGRSSQEKARENRARMVDSAQRLFCLHGVDQVSVADVTRACGLTVGGFYRHFDSKQSLVAEACGQAFDQAHRTWDTICRRAQAGGKPGRAELVRRYIHHRAADRRCPILAFVPPPGDAVAVPAYEAGVRELLARFMDHAAPWHGEGEAMEVATTDAAVRDALVLFAAMVGARLLHQAAGSVDWVRDIEDAVIAAAAART